ncbi:kinase-like domain-containing protein [Gigaspora margarita]|uniref:Kinase-like domain-containing protein n=1 Tax=Gigaspora margarita TaxID=4874 RepID=A0A8H4ELJ1_GIGMA|nr:kinase-like domain-containing protein [Gigaspora margarita]
MCNRRIPYCIILLYTSIMDWLKIATEQELIKFFEYDSFQDWKKVGSGGFGNVHCAYSKDIEKIVALKSLHYDTVNDTEDDLNGFIKEVLITFIICQCVTIRTMDICVI